MKIWNVPKSIIKCFGMCQFSARDALIQIQVRIQYTFNGLSTREASSSHTIRVDNIRRLSNGTDSWNNPAVDQNWQSVEEFWRTGAEADSHKRQEKKSSAWGIYGQRWFGTGREVMVRGGEKDCKMMNFRKYPFMKEKWRWEVRVMQYFAHGLFKVDLCYAIILWRNKASQDKSNELFKHNRIVLEGFNWNVWAPVDWSVRFLIVDFNSDFQHCWDLSWNSCTKKVSVCLSGDT